MDKLKFSDIKTHIRAHYKIDINWDYLKLWLEDMDKRITDGLSGNLELEPDFQRAHVWDKEKQIKYIEFILKDGESGRCIYWNCKGWQNSYIGKMQLVDGLQRITAVRKFLNNEIKVFNCYRKDFEGRMPFHACFQFYIDDLNTRKEVLQWYLELNSGVVAHTKEELNKVKDLLNKEEK